MIAHIANKIICIRKLLLPNLLANIESKFNEDGFLEELNDG